MARGAKVSRRRWGRLAAFRVDSCRNGRFAADTAGASCPTRGRVEPLGKELVQARHVQQPFAPMLQLFRRRCAYARSHGLRQIAETLLKHSLEQRRFAGPTPFPDAFL